MNRLKYLSLLLFMAVSMCQARGSMRQWFVAMPDSVMPLLTKNNRLDFIDFVDSGMDAVVTNRLEGKSRMNMLSDDYLHIEYTQTCDVAMKLLTVISSLRLMAAVTLCTTLVQASHLLMMNGQQLSLSLQYLTL